MKLVTLLFLLAAAALAQVPAHYVVGPLTVDVVDIQVSVPYGAAETRATITACSDQQFTKLQVYAGSSSAAGLDSVANYEVSAVKAGTAYCASVVATAERAKLTQLEVSAVNKVTMPVDAVPPPTSESKASKQRF